ncbi:hypothetical protein [Xylanibacter muris]|uniref:Uncharacterized protein n=1 Tax=Xylanibacter muris TaxID=2736290 RepID=A0ABX2AND3_9BACT|nr:hypothetical protein [Xylanibacter muris]NPD92645.1 hypothetical protein [Xylanibacter muris]
MPADGWGLAFPAWIWAHLSVFLWMRGIGSVDAGQSENRMKTDAGRLLCKCGNGGFLTFDMALTNLKVPVHKPSDLSRKAF